MFPESFLGRILAVLWLIACVGVLAFGYQQQHIHDMPVAFIWFMIFLTFPAGYVVSAFISLLWPAITAHLGLTYHPFWELVPFWFLSVVVGYLQWFFVLPKVVGKLRRISSRT